MCHVFEYNFFSFYQENHKIPENKWESAELYDKLAKDHDIHLLKCATDLKQKKSHGV